MRAHIMLLPHAPPHYLPVEDFIILHIDNFFALSPFISTFLRRIYAKSFKSKFIILTILHLLLTVVEPPVFVQEEKGDIIRFRSSVVCSSVN